MLWSWKKEDPDSLTAEMVELKTDDKIVQFEDTEDEATTIDGNKAEKDEDEGDTGSPIDHTG